MLEILYVAGIIDGEGWIGFNVNRQTYEKSNYTYLRIALEVRMTHMELVKKLQEQFGGSFQICKIYKKKNKQTYTWKIVSNEAASFLEKVVPYLIVKKEQAELALSFHKLGVGNNLAVNNFFKTEMHKLNKRGVEN